MDAGDDPTLTHLVDVPGHPAGPQYLAEPEGGLNGDDVAVGRDRVGGEHHACGAGLAHPLDDDGHLGQPGVDAAVQPVGRGPLREQ